MFIQKQSKHLPAHISCWTYHRDKRINQMPEEDKIKIEEFYESQRILYKELTSYQQVVVFKRTTNFIYIVGHYFNTAPQAKFKAKLGLNIGYGIIRTQSYVFYKTGEILYELDHDYQQYPDTCTTQIEHKNLLKINYDLHDKLNNNLLKEIGSKVKNHIQFDRACHALLRDDTTPRSVDYIKENK